MERTRVARIKDGKLRFRHLMCPFCCAMVMDNDPGSDDRGFLEFDCPNCRREFKVDEIHYDRWKELDVA